MMATPEKKYVADGNRPTVGIIGGGIFGATCALILGEEFDVILFEEKDDILEGASRANQYRHHVGYHYPRSETTIQEIKDARKDFEAYYGSCIDTSFPSYYCISKDGSRVSSEEFLAVCDRMGLPYEREYPDASFLDPATVDLCVRVPEASYDFDALQHLIKERLLANKRIKFLPKHKVVGISREGEKKKVLAEHMSIREAFECTYLINATYAQYNTFCGWLGFPERPLELRYKELPIIQIPDHARAAVTVMDGPFATLVPIGGSKDLYTLGDVPLSVHKAGDVQAMDALRNSNPASRFQDMLKRCEVWFPLLSKARFVRSMFVVLPVDPGADETDERPTELTYHGDGCWSILSGKIITSVTAAKRIASAILAM